MKSYVKPVMEVIELRPEERLAGSPSVLVPTAPPGPGNSDFGQGQGQGGGKGKGKG